MVLLPREFAKVSNVISYVGTWTVGSRQWHRFPSEEGSWHFSLGTGLTRRYIYVDIRPHVGTPVFGANEL